MAIGEVRSIAPFGGVCMHVPEVTCENCIPTFNYRDDYYWRRDPFVRPPTVPNDATVPDVKEDGGEVGTDIKFFRPCRGGHDFVACDGHVICNVCEKVVKVSE